MWGVSYISTKKKVKKETKKEEGEEEEEEEEKKKTRAYPFAAAFPFALGVEPHNLLKRSDLGGRSDY